MLIEGVVEPDALAAAGVQIGTEAGPVTTALLPLDALPDLLAQPGVTSVRAPARLEPQLTVSATDIGAPILWSGTPPVYTGPTGKGVVIGIIDTGIDLTHPDFRTTSNKTRVKYLWDQTSTGAGPTGFGYGIEYTSTQIDGGGVTTTDSNGHGTHIAGVAAGNGQATGNGYAAWRYVGIAPEADLIIVKSSLLENQIIDGARYIYQKAAAIGAGEKAVVLIAAGSERGAHDGSYALEQSLSALTGAGKLMVASVGNNSTSKVHADLTLASTGASGSLTFTVPTYTPNVSISEKFELSGWHEASAAFDVKLTSPSGYTTGWITPGVQSTRLRTRDGAFAIWNDTRATAKGGKEIYIYCLDDSANIGPKPGNWTLNLQRRTGTTTGRVDFWLFDWVWPGYAEPSFAVPDFSMLVSTPACGDSIIGVGAYTSRISWPGTNGLPVTLTDPTAIVGNLATFSAYGPRRDGAVRPDVVAPGQMVAAALSAPVSARLGTSGYKVDDGMHWVIQGTSVAAAHAAGGLALFLQQQPTLTPSGARLLLRSKAVMPAGVAAPSNGWGYGKMELVAQAPTAVGDEPGRFSFAPPIPNPMRNEALFHYVLTENDLAGAHGVRLQIFNIAGRQVASIPAPAEAGAHSVKWAGTSADGQPAPAGIYLARLVVGARSEIRKFVRVN